MGPQPGGSAASLRALTLHSAQIGPGVTGHVIDDGTIVRGQVSLDLCNQRFASEALRSARLQTAWVSHHPTYYVSNELIGYRPGGAREGMHELRAVAAHCPTTPQAPVVAGNVPASFVLTPLHISGLRPGYLALRVLITASVAGQPRSQATYVIYQDRGAVISAIYAGPGGTLGLRVATHAARLSARALDAR